MKPLPLILATLLVFAVSLRPPCSGKEPQAEFVPVKDVEAQPLLLHVERLQKAMDNMGEPFSADIKMALNAAKKLDDAAAVAKVQAVLDPLCLAAVVINPESRVKVQKGPAKPELVEKGWRSFLVKVSNEAGVTAPLSVESPQAIRLHNSPADKVRDRWMELQVAARRPLQPALNGLALEYRVLQIYSRDAGKRSAVLNFDIGQGVGDLGFRAELNPTFTAIAGTPVTLKVLDDQGEPTVAAFEIRDAQGRVYPSQAKRLAPDFFFHPQVYRADGEVEVLPPGTYKFKVQRGPESVPEWRSVRVQAAPMSVAFKMQRWVDPAARGWWSGDHHIHAAGCSHYTNPSEGVHAEDMLRHCKGEDLKIGANLTWGPCFDYQKQFFTGKDDKVSTYPYLLRYDVEVSGFGSHRSGHLCLLRLKEQIYPGGDSKHHWPTLCLNTLKWAKKQGALCGPAHSGWGLKVPAELPSYVVPAYDGIGACEYIVDVTHKVEGPNGKQVPAVDFLSLVDTPWPWELNIWYHTLNCGFRTRASGETDFPCIYGERVGLGRSYVELDGKLDYNAWCEGIREGRCYVSDGRSHLMGFEVDGHKLGPSTLKLAAAKTVKAKALVSARLTEKTSYPMHNLNAASKPYWHLERARKPGTRTVKVALVVNGEETETKWIEADGTEQEIAFETRLEKSSWLALRILPSSHTNPIFVEVGGKPIRANKKSAEWCLKGVDQCWSQKKHLIAAAEMDDAKAAYEHARKAYRKIIGESEGE